jgi:uncharacterized protein
MKIVFDDSKRASTLALRGLDFADLTINFFAGATIIQAKDSRFKAVGELGSTIITVIFKPLGSEALSVNLDAPGQQKREERSCQGQFLRTCRL